jgi:predicted DNA binding CopG/RHH family protein
MPEKFKYYLKESARHIQIADHMTYVTLPIVNDQKLILKIFEEIFKSINNSLNSVMSYEFSTKNIILHKDNRENIKNFIENLAGNYDLNEKEITKIKRLFEINERYKKSAIEFVKKEKVIMMSDSLDINSINLEDIKEYLLLAKSIFLKVSSKLKS